MCLEWTVCVHNYWKKTVAGSLFDPVEFLVILLGFFATVFQGNGYHLTLLIVEVCGTTAGPAGSNITECSAGQVLKC